MTQRPELVAIFRQLLGDSDELYLTGAVAKYERLKTACARWLAVLRSICEQLGRLRAPAPTELLAELEREAAELFTAPAEILNALDPEAIPPTSPAYRSFQQKYRRLQNARVISRAVITCAALSPHRAHIGDRRELRGAFLARLPHYCVLDGCDFAPVFRAQSTPGGKASVLLMLSDLYVSTHEVFEAVQVPDVDVDAFSTIVEDAISRMRQVPELCEYEETFDILRKSISKLHDNFGKYYQEFLRTRLPATILESFIRDVAGSFTGAVVGADPGGDADARVGAGPAPVAAPAVDAEQAGAGPAPAAPADRKRKIRHMKIMRGFGAIMRYYNGLGELLPKDLRAVTQIPVDNSAAMAAAATGPPAEELAAAAAALDPDAAAPAAATAAAPSAAPTVAQASSALLHLEADKTVAVAVDPAEPALDPVRIVKRSEKRAKQRARQAAEK